MKSVLLTGFLPFSGETINPSQLLVEKVTRSQVRKKILPVGFQKAFQLLQAEVEQSCPSFILMLGQAGGRQKICLERFALNWIETQNADEFLVKPETGPIVAGARDLYQNSLALEQWAHELSVLGVPTQVSLSAGGFVCNELSYRIAQYLDLNQLQSRSLFIHLPFLPSQVPAQSNEPSLEFEKMEKAIHWILDRLLQ